MNEILNLIDDELFQQNIDSEITSDKIEWKDNFGAENEIIINFCDRYLDNLAWWKFNSAGKDLVMFTQDNFLVSWQPPLNNMGISLGCKYLKFHKSKLVVAYQDKHYQRLYSLNTKDLKATELYLCRKLHVTLIDNILFIKDDEKNVYLSVNLDSDLNVKTFHDEAFFKLNGIEI